MKLILAIVQDKDSNLLSSQFIDANIQANVIINDWWLFESR